MVVNRRKASSSLPELVDVAEMPRSKLIAIWQRLFKTEPGKNIAGPTLLRVIAYELQCRSHGGLSQQNKRILKGAYAAQKPSPTLSVVATTRNTGGKPSKTKAEHPRLPLLSPGTQLVRNWNGRPYRVEIVEDGYVLDGKTYKSLSAIARKITGAHWSGPRFFGLKKAS